MSKKLSWRTIAYFFFFIPLTLITTVFFFVFKNFPSQKKVSEPEIPPLEVKTTNITKTGFTVTWLTEKESAGSVIFSENLDSVSFPEKKKKDIKTAFDSRGKTNLSLTHSVTLANLTAGKKYYFIIQSGNYHFVKKLDNTWGRTGFPENQSVPTEFPKINSQFIWGQVIDRNLQPVSNTLVFLEIPAESNLLSALTNSKGQWSFNLDCLISWDLQPLVNNPEDLLRIVAENRTGNSASVYLKYIKGITEPVLLRLN